MKQSACWWSIGKPCSILHCKFSVTHRVLASNHHRSSFFFQCWSIYFIFLLTPHDRPCCALVHPHVNTSTLRFSLTRTDALWKSNASIYRKWAAAFALHANTTHFRVILVDRMQGHTCCHEFAQIQTQTESHTCTYTYVLTHISTRVRIHTFATLSTHHTCTRTLTLCTSLHARTYITSHMCAPL